MPVLLSLLAREVLSLAVEKLAFCPFLTLWMACCHAADDLGAEGQRGLDELATHQGSQEAPGPLARVFRLGGADAVEEASHLLATAGYPEPSATIPAPAPTIEAPSPEPSPEEHLRAALASLEAAIRGFGPGPGTYALEYNALDLRAALAALGFARALEAEKAAEAA